MSIRRPAAKYVTVETLRMTAAAVALLWSAGTLGWWPAWAALAGWMAAEMAIGFVLVRIHPELLAERISLRKGDAAWDKAVMLGFRLSVLALIVLAGLDHRHGWTDAWSLPVQIAGMAVWLLGHALFVWAMVANRFFSGMVRIQSGRGHTVATGGPYRFVRHPGYVGAIVGQFGLPMLLASWWAFLPGMLGALLLVVRTRLEDRTLRLNLAGYAEFARRVPYRLVPGLW